MLIRWTRRPKPGTEVLNAGLQLLLLFGDEGLAFSAGPLPEAVMALPKAPRKNTAHSTRCSGTSPAR